MIIGLSQRVEKSEKTDEIRDCLDQNWSKLLSDYGHTAVPIPNNPKSVDDFIKATGIQGVVLTGGNDHCSFEAATNVSKERDQTESIILKHAFEHAFPVLGVCRGFQFINMFFGGYVGHGVGHVASFHAISVVSKILGDFEHLTVNSFHNYVIERRKLAANLLPLALAPDDTVEAAYHRDLNCIGIMWHPERTLCGLDERILKTLFG